jgi:peptidoglycan/LPS O-acetylase OafA/YrhL
MPAGSRIVSGEMEIPTNRPLRYWSLDALRGLCSLSVFATHWILGASAAPSGAVAEYIGRVLQKGYEVFNLLVAPTGGHHPAVICFFVLSGFCVHRPAECRLAQSQDSEPWGIYFRRRARRILPVYWAGTALGLLVVVLQRWRPQNDPVLIYHTLATPAQVAARVGGYGALWPEEIFLGNPPLGTVGVEILIYLAYPLFFRAARAGRWRLLGGIVVGLHLLTLPLQPYVDPFVLFGSVLIMSLFWYMGALAAHLYERRDWQVRGWWLCLAWICFLLLKAVPHFYGLNLLKQAVWALVCMLLIVWLLGWEKRHEALQGQVWSRWLRWTGKISYSLYAVHTPAILLAGWAIFMSTGKANYLAHLGIAFLLTIAATLVVHHGIERRFYRSRG